MSTRLLPLRLATAADVPGLRRLIDASVRALSAGYYTPEQVESSLAHIFGPDTALIADGTNFVVDYPERPGQLAAAGGWSRRKTLYGGDQTKHAPDPLLDPAADPARIRAFYVHPECSRQGLGRRLLEACASAAAAAGFTQLDLVATLPGEPLYAAFGFEAVERYAIPLPDEIVLPVVRMRRHL